MAGGVSASLLEKFCLKELDINVMLVTDILIVLIYILYVLLKITVAGYNQELIRKIKIQYFKRFFQ